MDFISVCLNLKCQNVKIKCLFSTINIFVKKKFFKSFKMTDQDEGVTTVDYLFTNTDDHLEEEQERAAKLIWVGVANSTKHKLKIKWSVTGARRETKPSWLIHFFPFPRNRV